MNVDVIVRVEITGPPPDGKKVQFDDLTQCCRDAVSDSMCRAQPVCWLELQGYQLKVKRVFVPAELPNDNIPEIVHEGAD